MRGLAGEGAQAIVDAALTGVTGIVSARARIAHGLLQIEYDESRVSEAEIHDALRQAGIVYVGNDSHGGTES